MKIYFACSITGGRDDEGVYQVIVQSMLDDGHEVLTAQLAFSTVMEDEGVVDPLTVFARDVAWINESDALVAEVSTPSHGVGFEIGYALNAGKPVLCCYQEGLKVSKMILGNTDPLLMVRGYATEEEAVRVVGNFLGELNV